MATVAHRAMVGRRIAGSAIHRRVYRIARVIGLLLHRPRSKPQASIMKLSCVSSMLRSLAMNRQIYQELKTGLTSLMLHNGAWVPGVVK